MPSLLSRTGWSRARRRRRPLPPEWEKILEDQVAYDRALPAAEREELRGVLQILMGELSFESGGGLEAVNEAMQVVIAAQASVLLLHRPLNDLPSLRTAIVYPGAYKAREQLQTDEGVEVEENEERYGEAWAHGVLLFSWEDVVYDAQHIGDGRNIVFHEVAHALDDQNGEADGIPLFADRAQAAAWVRVFTAAFERHERDVARRRRTLLDDYAAEEPAEFFAAATEVFFEAPGAFRAEFPELYDQMREFYRVDPLSWAARLEGGRSARSTRPD